MYAILLLMEYLWLPGQHRAIFKGDTCMKVIQKNTREGGGHTRLIMVAFIIIVIAVAVLSSGFFSNSTAGTNSDAKSIVNSQRTIKAAREFVHKAANGNMFEVEESKVALEKSNNANVREFAEHMVADHEKAGQELEQSIDASSIQRSDVPKELDPDMQAKLDKLSALEGELFNKQYIADQKAAHKDAVSLFRQYANNGQDGSLKSFAQKTLPTLEEHNSKVQLLSAR